MTLRGWNAEALGAASGVHGSTVRRFINGTYQTARTAERLARALGYPMKRYFNGVEAIAV